MFITNLIFYYWPKIWPFRFIIGFNTYQQRGINTLRIYYFTIASVIPHTLILISTMPKFQLCQHAVALTKSPSAIFHTYHQKKIYFEVYLDLSFLILCHIILRPCLKFRYVPSWQSTYVSDVSYRNMAKSSSFPHFFLYFQEV